MIIVWCVVNRVQVPARSSSRTTQAKGIYPGAKVMRGPDWAARYKDQDGKIMMNVNVLRQYGAFRVTYWRLDSPCCKFDLHVYANKIKKT